MKRSHPLFTIPGFTLTIFLFFWLGFSLWRNGGRAFSPGRLSGLSRPDVKLSGFSSHAEFEDQCAACHKPLVSPQAPLCINCHQDIGTQIDAAQGTHGSIVDVQDCAACHKEHRGLDFNPIESALSKFNHNQTQFSLRHHLIGYDTLPMNCTVCHTNSQNSFSLTPDVCVSCHTQHDSTFMKQHLKDFGSDCLDCHDGLDSVADFDHQQTVFPLTGAHFEAGCSDCHKKTNFKETPQACNSCHKQPDLHLGMFGDECAVCHTTDNWSPASLNGTTFEHDTLTGFSLNRHRQTYQQTPLVCADCHGSISKDNPAFNPTFDVQDCIDCHTRHDADFMAQHQAELGPACIDCHDGKDRMQGFNHVTFFALDGQHANLACASCHKKDADIPHYKNTPSECWQCHAEPQIHAGFFGLKCERCHETSAWTPALLHSHDFPLEHGLAPGSQPTDCQNCHPANYVSYTCYGCHEHQEDVIQNSHLGKGIAADEIPQCILCHADGGKNDR